MAATAEASRDEKALPRLYWENILVLIGVHLAGVAAVVYAVTVRRPWQTLVLAAVWTLISSLSITGGYHRLFSHRTYRASALLRLIYLLFGAAAGQGSALRWSTDHRSHHAHTDEEGDPHNIRRGFWWAHIGWLFYRSPAAEPGNVKDLEADPLVRFQDRFYVLLAVVVGFVVPAGLGWIWGDPLGGLLIAGFLRLALQYEATFSINSVAHSVGRQPYARDTTARDSAIAAMVTFGEGYHNYHHRFPADYRNGVRWFHFDPTKWWVWGMSLLGLARDLKRVPADAIQKAKEALAVGSAASVE